MVTGPAATLSPLGSKPGPIAQRLERLPHKEQVAGSNPAGPTRISRLNRTSYDCDWGCLVVTAPPGAKGSEIKWRCRRGVA